MLVELHCNETFLRFQLGFQICPPHPQNRMVIDKKGSNYRFKLVHSIPKEPVQTVPNTNRAVKTWTSGSG